MQPRFNNNQSLDALLSEVEAADLLGLSTRTLQSWRTQETGPAFVRAGRAIRYRRGDLLAWIEVNTIRTGRDASERKPDAR